ncbi:MAG: hypothetical protein L0H70_05555 [Xanthomonadales bacterium]|nr:hypothetical protein [Xanthomonadales bacterium]
MSAATPAAMSSRRMLMWAGSLAVVGGIGLLIAAVVIKGRMTMGFGWVAIVTGGIWLLCARFASAEPLRKAERRYLREFFPAMAAYVIVVLTLWPMVAHIDSVVGKVLLSLLPVVPVIFVVRAMLRLLLASDELQQRMQLQAICIASLTVGLLSFAAAFMRSAGVLVWDNALMWVLPALFGVYGIALLWIHRRYRDE